MLVVAAARGAVFGAAVREPQWRRGSVWFIKVNVVCGEGRKQAGESVVRGGESALLPVNQQPGTVSSKATRRHGDRTVYICRSGNWGTNLIQACKR